MSEVKVLGISGSLRRESLNTMALRNALAYLQSKGCLVKEASLKELALPVYDGDLETQGFPPSVNTWVKMVKEADLLVIASPEYNHSIPGGLKNALDWASLGKSAWFGKTAAVFGVSNGAFGTARGQAHLRYVLQALGVNVAPQPELMIKFGEEAYEPDGSFKDPKTKEIIEKLLDKSLELFFALQSSSLVEAV